MSSVCLADVQDFWILLWILTVHLTGNPKTRKPETGNQNPEPETGIRKPKPESGIRNPQIEEKQVFKFAKPFLHSFHL